MRAIAGELVAFGVVGAIGFAIDGGILTLLATRLGVDVYAARTISFSVATLATWLLNRRAVFRARAAPRGGRREEYVRYLAVQVCGAAINLGVFSALIAVHPALRAVPIVPLAVGAAIAMIFNYAGVRYWAFGGRP